jgi:hypothetical protein
MTDRTEIACIIAEWWHNQKDKKHLLESTITLEQFLQIDKLEPLEIIEEKVQLVLKKPGGRRKVIWKQKKNGHKVLKEKTYEFDGINYQVTIEDFQRLELENRLKMLGCDTCKSEIYYQSEQEDGLTYCRDCLCADAQDYFNRKCVLKFSHAAIPPVTNCRCWKGINGYVKEPVKEIKSVV